MKTIHLISRFAGYSATAMLGLLMVLTVADVIGYLFKAPVKGTPELSEFMMVTVVFLALAWCAVTRKHVRVDLVVSHFPSKVQVIVDSITLLITFFTYCVIAWQSVLESLAVYDDTSILRLPHSPFYWIMTFGFALFCLAIMALFIENIIEARKR